MTPFSVDSYKSRTTLSLNFIYHDVTCTFFITLSPRFYTFFVFPGMLWKAIPIMKSHSNWRFNFYHKSIIKNYNNCTTIQNNKVGILVTSQNQVNVLIYAQGSKKIGPVGRQNKKNIIWFLRVGIFLKIIFRIAGTEEICFLVLDICISLLCFISIFFQKAQNKRFKKNPLVKSLWYYFFVFA